MIDPKKVSWRMLLRTTILCEPTLLSSSYFDVLTATTYRLIDSAPKKSRRNTSKVVLDEPGNDNEDDFDIVNVDQSSGDIERYLFSLLFVFFLNC